MKESFPELFCIAGNRDAFVAEHMLVHNDEVHWAMNFVTQDSFFSMLYILLLSLFGLGRFIFLLCLVFCILRSFVSFCL
jgi:hypothetical protein